MKPPLRIVDAIIPVTISFQSFPGGRFQDLIGFTREEAAELARDALQVFKKCIPIPQHHSCYAFLD